MVGALLAGALLGACLRGSAQAWRGGVEGIVSGDRLDESQGESEPDRNGNSSQPREDVRRRGAFGGLVRGGIPRRILPILGGTCAPPWEARSAVDRTRLGGGSPTVTIFPLGQGPVRPAPPFSDGRGLWNPHRAPGGFFLPRHYPETPQR